MLAEWDQVRKLDASPTFEIGLSTITSLIPSGSGAGIATGFSTIEAGVTELAVGGAELFLVIDGKLEAHGAGSPIRVDAGEGIWFPPGVRVRIETKAPCRVAYVIMEAPF